MQFRIEPTFPAAALIKILGQKPQPLNYKIVKENVKKCLKLNEQNILVMNLIESCLPPEGGRNGFKDKIFKNQNFVTSGFSAEE